MIGYIYKTTNLVNNKIYIGQHRATKFEPEKYLGSGTLFEEALAKYGKDKFKNEFICSCETQDELNEKEIYWIAFFNATDHSIGYNIALGGTTSELTDEIKDKISATLLSKKMHCYNNGSINKYFSDTDNIPPEFRLGRILINVSEDSWKEKLSVASSNAPSRPQTELTKQKLSESHKGERIYNNGAKEIRLHENEEIPAGFIPGPIMTEARQKSLEKLLAGAARGNAERKNWPEEIRKEKLGKQNIGRTPPNARKILCIETQQIFNSIAAVQKLYSVSQYQVQTAILKNRELCGYHWQYLE